MPLTVSQKMIIKNIKRTKLFREIKEELNEDVSNFCVSDRDDLESWSETCLDCPSNTLSDLLEKVPEQNTDLWYDCINDVISDVVSKVSKEFEDEDGEDGDDEEDEE